MGAEGLERKIETCEGLEGNESLIELKKYKTFFKVKCFTKFEMQIPK